MEVHLTPDQKAFVRQAIESGRLNREEDAIQEALSLWEQRERFRAEILTAVDAAELLSRTAEGARSPRNPCANWPTKSNSAGAIA
jgi:Arc/MetJ-type ribon-helix-helix transcriptional regulator